MPPLAHLFDCLPDSLVLDHLPDLNHRHLISSGSTNSELITDVQNGTLNAAEMYLLTAETQSAGRGQHGRSWQSPRGNVYLSLYYPVHMPISGLLSLIIGVELAKMPVIQTLNKQLLRQKLTPIGVKWANDLGFYQPSSNVAQDESESAAQTLPFHKLAGILIESVTQAGKLVGVVMGVGLNVQATPQLTAQTCEGMSYQAVSLQDIERILEPKAPASSLPSLRELYQQMSKALMAAMTRFEHLGLEKPTGQSYNLDRFLEQFDSMDALAGLRLRVTQEHNGQTDSITGHACGIDTHGCLQLRQDNGNISALLLDASTLLIRCKSKTQRALYKGIFMLWLDLGNTRLKYWLTDDIGQIVAHDAKQHLQAPAELLMGLTDRFERYAPDFIGISSVLGDDLNMKVSETLSRLNIPFKFVHVDANYPLMKSAYNDEQLGCDRWLQMLGAVDKTKRQCVIGCGTAVTIDLIDHAEHLGGYIFPSIYLQRESLFSGTKQITISNGTFDSVSQGITTQDAVHRGIMLSIVGAINEISTRHPNFEIIMTGGDAAIIAQHINRPVRLRDDLLLNGLARYFDHNKQA